MDSIQEIKISIPSEHAEAVRIAAEVAGMTPEKMASGIYMHALRKSMAKTLQLTNSLEEKEELSTKPENKMRTKDLKKEKNNIPPLQGSQQRRKLFS